MPGDIVTRLEGVTVGLDGTMSDYCDVMRTHSPGDVLSVEVLRYATEEVLTGQFNGDQLTTAFSFAEEIETPDAGAAYTDYVTVTDVSGVLTVSVPTAWADVDGAPIDIDGVSSPSIIASSSVAEYNSRWDVPGVQFVASQALVGYSPDELLDLAASTDCTFEGAPGVRRRLLRRIVRHLSQLWRHRRQLDRGGGLSCPTAPTPCW
ncbi:MAG: hypothetical protein R2713_10840 [Ilumatobacteraceae bacterium]